MSFRLDFRLDSLHGIHGVLHACSYGYWGIHLRNRGVAEKGPHKVMINAETGQVGPGTKRTVVEARDDVAHHRSSPALLPSLRYGSDPVLESSYLHASNSVIVIATHVPADYLVFTPGRKSAWGVLSLGRTDVGQ